MDLVQLGFLHKHALSVCRGSGPLCEWGRDKITKAFSLRWLLAWLAVERDDPLELKRVGKEVERDAQKANDSVGDGDNAGFDAGL